MRTISVISSKGGSGKTTLAVNLALSAHGRGGSVLLADIDAQQSAAGVLRQRTSPGPECLATCGGKLFQLQLGCSRRGLDWLLIDTPCQPDGEIAEAVKLSDLCLIVARPSFVDLAAALKTAQLVRQLHRPALVVINQAPPARHGIEAPLVAKAMRSLALTGFPVLDLPIRGRTAFQASLDEGLAAAEWEPEGPCGAEMEALWREIEAGPRVAPSAPCCGTAEPAMPVERHCSAA